MYAACCRLATHAPSTLCCGAGTRSRHGSPRPTSRPHLWSVQIHYKIAPSFSTWGQESRFEMYFAPKHRRCWVLSNRGVVGAGCKTRLASRIHKLNSPSISCMVAFSRPSLRRRACSTPTPRRTAQASHRPHPPRRQRGRQTMQQWRLTLQKNLHQRFQTLFTLRLWPTITLSNACVDGGLWKRVRAPCVRCLVRTGNSIRVVVFEGVTVVVLQSCGRPDLVCHPCAADPQLLHACLPTVTAILGMPAYRDRRSWHACCAPMG